MEDDNDMTKPLVYVPPRGDCFSYLYADAPVEPPPPEHEPETVAHAVAVVAAGATISEAAQDALDDFIIAIADFKSKFKLLWLPCCTFPGIAEPFLSQGVTLTNVNFEAADWNINGYLTGLATETRRLLSNIAGNSVSHTDSEFGFYCDCADTRTVVRGFFGCNDAQPPTMFFNATANHNILGRIHSTSNAAETVTSTANALTPDLFSLSANSATSLKAIRGNTTTATNVNTRSAPVDTNNIAFFCRGVTSYANYGLSYIGYSTALTDPERGTLYTALQTFMTAKAGF